MWQLAGSSSIHDSVLLRDMSRLKDLFVVFLVEGRVLLLHANIGMRSGLFEESWGKHFHYQHLTQTSYILTITCLFQFFTTMSMNTVELFFKSFLLLLRRKNFFIIWRPHLHEKWFFFIKRHKTMGCPNWFFMKDHRQIMLQIQAHLQQ